MVDSLSQKPFFPPPRLTLYVRHEMSYYTPSPPRKKFQIPYNVLAFFSNFGLIFVIHSLSKRRLLFLLPSKWYFVPPPFVEGLCNSGKSKDEDQEQGSPFTFSGTGHVLTALTFSASVFIPSEDTTRLKKATSPQRKSHLVGFSTNQ